MLLSKFVDTGRREWIEGLFVFLFLSFYQTKKSIAFPCISTGVYGYPNEQAARTAISTIIDFLESDDQLDLVVFCVFLERDLSVYEDLLEQLVVE